MSPSAHAMGIISLTAESVLVGIYAVLIVMVFWLLVKGHRSMPVVHRLLFGASILMFFISAVHVGLLTQEKTIVGPIFLPNMQSQIVLATVQFVIGDLILIWRVWVIWDKKYWIAAGPFAIMIAAAGLTLNVAFGPVVPSFFAMAPAALIVANTSMYMHYQVSKIAKKAGISNMNPSSYNGAMALVVESGALYTACQFISLILDHTKSSGLTVILNIEIPLIGILPTLIIVLVHYDMVPGGRVTKNYAASTSLKFAGRSRGTVDAPAKSQRSLDDGGQV